MAELGGDMNDNFRKLVEQLRGLWGRWTAAQKLILLAVVGAGDPGAWS